MGARLQVDVKETNDISCVRLSGVVDEDNDLNEVLKRISRSVVVINTANVERINSCGVRDWVTWLGDLEKRAEIFLVECSPSIMSQVNLVSNFLRSGVILTFFAPYYCVECDTSRMLIIDAEDARTKLPFKAPTSRCEQCDHAMEFDDIESSYFSFLSGASKKTLDPLLIEKVKQANTESSKGLPASQSMGHQTTPSNPHTPSGTGGPLIPTIPGSRDLKGIITDSHSFSSLKTTTAQAGTGTSKILYVIIGLLVAAIGLLAVVLLRAT
jgi:anti-anti-sigma regulatory factor